jgi:uncharacterized protein (TIGR04255 family)
MAEKMNNAPVYYVIAQVRHNPVLSLGTYAPEIQEHMRKAGYPDYRPGKALVFNLMMHATDGSAQPLAPTTETVERHTFLSMDCTRGFIVEQGSFSFHTTEYDVFKAFSSDFFAGLEIVHKCLGLDFSDRVGIRYLDAVVPVSGESELKDYLAPGVLGLAGRLPSAVPIAMSLSETHIQMPDANLLSRTLIQNGPLGFPMDLATQGLLVPPRFQQVNGVHAIIDTDASQEGRRPFDLERLRERLDVLHKRIRMAFDASVTDHALEMWK